jgi:predicted outer membrane protein
MSDLRISSVAWLTSVLLIGSAACEGDTQDDPGSRSQASDSVDQNATNNTAVAGSSAGSAQGLGSGTSLNAPDGGAAAVDLVDPQIISALSNVNAGAIERGTIATDAAQSVAVRTHAQELIDTRLAAQERLTALVATTGFAEAVNVSVAENAVSDALQSESKSIVTQLRAADAAGFDVLFLQSQVQVLSHVLDLIDTRLLPSVESALLRAELERVRAESDVLLQRARALLAVLDNDADGGVSDVDAGF